MADPDALTAILGLTGQLLEHNAQVQNIKTSALLQRDEMEFKSAQLAKERQLEFDKSAFQIQMKDIKTMEAELEDINTQYTERTGKIPSNPTSGFTDFHQKGADKADEYTDLLDAQAKQQQKLATEIIRRKKELNEINNALSYISKNVNYVGGDDPTKWDAGDYNDAITNYKAEANLTDLSDDMQAAIDKETPGAQELQDLNLVLAEKSAKETKQKLDAARLRHEEQNLDQTKILMDIQSDRETLQLIPALQSLMVDGSTATDIISSTMTSDDFKNNPSRALEEAYATIAGSNALFDLVGADVYLEAYGAGTGKNAAPEYFVNRVILPAIATLQAYGEFIIAYPEADTKTFADDKEKRAYQKKRTSLLDGFLVKLTKTLGTQTHDANGALIKENIVTPEKIKAVANKLKRLLGDGDILNNNLTNYSKLIGGNVRAAIEAGLDGEGDLSIHLDPHIQDLLELIKTSQSGNYKGSKNDETSITPLDSLELIGDDIQKDEDEEYVLEQLLRAMAVGSQI